MNYLEVRRAQEENLAHSSPASLPHIVERSKKSPTR